MIDMSLIISFLSALLTGGFLMLFSESQKLSASVTEGNDLGELHQRRDEDV